MVQVNYFTLTNFRGAKDIKLEISGKTSNKVVTLIGLNESGKTTILEGLSLFPISHRAAASVFKTLPAAALESSMIPIHKTGVFTGDIRVLCQFTLSDFDRAEITRIVKEAGYDLDTSAPINSINVSKSFSFSEGDYVPEKFSSAWGGVDLYARKNKRSAYKKAEPNAPFKGDKESLWNVVVDHLRTKLPHVVYFPNFIVEIPRKIYISEFTAETVTNSYYRRIIESAMLHSSEELSLKAHVLERIEKYKSNYKGDNWISALMNSDEKDKIDAVFTRLSGILTDVVLGSWGKVFNRPTTAVRLDVRWHVDPGNEQPFVEVKISDGRSSYHLHQRSLGFRWFFSFLLFTQFGRNRSRPNIFLFDEPAANLHARAQAELLSSFEKLADAGDLIIYSTHSHHMIRPEWLSGAYIVENEAIDYDEEANGVLGAPKDTSIKVTPYRRFVGENGSRVSYYQPVLERLQYIQPRLDEATAQLLVEGPTDFYALSYVLKRSEWAGRFTVIPGTGSGTLDSLISLALGRANNFLVLLDDDGAGRSASARYREKFYLGSSNVQTLGELDVRFTGAELETFLSGDTLLMVRAKYGNAKKASIGHYLAEICALNEEGALDSQTVRNYLEIIDLVGPKISLGD
ncbi:AAA family ATPase [Devosia sp. 1566]|uniref:AAA family ATPase n=1 Tax=Devosia sp. 1566 TaxID=2499144 RepID=UPI0013E31799|nr:AAA family ATPase [Devosia sp. 1566]